MQRAAELAVQEINARGGVNGRLLELEILDDSGSEDVALRIAERLTANPRVVAVIGHLTSGASKAAARVYGGRDRPVAMISPSASSPDLSGISPWVFRVCPSDLAFGPRLARVARQQLGARRVAVLFVNNDYGRGVRQSFVNEFRQLGGEVIEQNPALTTTPTLEPYLARIQREGGVDALMLALERGGAELALREMSRLGARWPVLGGDALTGVEGLGAAAEGVRMSLPYLADRPGEANAAFVAAYARAFPGQRPDHRGAGAYDIVNLLARALADVGPDRRAVRDYLARVGNGAPAYDGVTGRIAFDSLGDVPTKPVVIGIVRGGRLTAEVAP
jgi:branched-chain amino acid transport system substrate-binding protein